MAGDSPTQSGSVLVVGGGMGGLTAALRAREKGAAVTLIEKYPDLTHSSTFIAGGGFTIRVEPYGEYTPAQLILAFQETSECRCDLDLVSVFARRIAADFAWLKDDLGVSMTPNPNRKGTFMVDGRGAAIPPHMERAAREGGVDLLLQTEAKRFLTDGAGRVTGIEALTPAGPREIHAGAVVLATGGFEANGEMVRKYLGEEVYATAFKHRVTPPGHTGDGQRMAMDVGASFARKPFLIHCGAEDKAWEKPGVRPKNQGGPTRALLRTSKWGLWVNGNGKRFVDESAESDTVSTAIMRQPGGAAALIFDEAVRQRFPEEAETYAKAVPGAILEGQSLGEIAEKIGAPPAELARTVGEYNGAVTNGRAPGLEIPKGAYMATAAPLTKAPFYAVHPVWCSMNTVWGGLEIDAEARVLGQDGTPIPGLYAAGAIFGGVFNGIWSQTLSGVPTYRSNHDLLAASLQVCLVFGRVAGEKAAAYAGDLA